VTLRRHAPALAAVAVAVAAAAAYRLAFPERSDYAGHFLAGAGGTLLLLAVVVLAGTPWRVVAAGALAVLAGVGTEATVFRLAEFDLVDLANQSLGALVACAAFLDARGPRASAGAAVSGTALAAWTAAARSTIPLAWHGTVTRVELRREKHPGVDDAWFVTVDGDERHVDVAVARLVREGARVDKDAWQRGLRVDGADHPLRYPRDARRMLLVAPAVAAAVALLAVYPRALWTRARTP
jgi:hypothetical protein